MKTSDREFKQHASRFLATAEGGESIVVIKNGQPVAVLTPVGAQGVSIPAHPTDPMGEDDDAPLFHDGSPIDWSAGRSDYLEGFGA